MSQGLIVAEDVGTAAASGGAGVLNHGSLPADAGTGEKGLGPANPDDEDTAPAPPPPPDISHESDTSAACVDDAGFQGSFVEGAAAAADAAPPAKSSKCCK